MSDLPDQNSAWFSFNFAPITPLLLTRCKLCKTPKGSWTCFAFSVSW